MVTTLSSDQLPAAIPVFEAVAMPELTSGKNLGAQLFDLGEHRPPQQWSRHSPRRRGNMAHSQRIFDTASVVGLNTETTAATVLNWVGFIRTFVMGVSCAQRDLG
jgi:hypothetical protein